MHGIINIWTFPWMFCKYKRRKLILCSSEKRNYLLCICIFILIPWELRILLRIALIKIPASFSYFTHLLSFYHMSYIPSPQGFPDLDLLGPSSVSLPKPDEPKSCVSTASLEKHYLKSVTSVFYLKMYLPQFLHAEDRQTKSHLLWQQA